MAKTPTCPYCGAEMTMQQGMYGMRWYRCNRCGIDSRAGHNEEDAREKALRRASPWHSVKDGLPDSGTVCVVHGHNKRGVDCCDIAYRSKTGWEFGGLTSFEVEHWMAVPDAPKEVEHNADT